MWRTIIKYSLAGVLATVISTASAPAQMFGDEGDVSAVSAPAAQTAPARGWSNRDVLANPTAVGRFGTVSPTVPKTAPAMPKRDMPATQNLQSQTEKNKNAVLKPPAKVKVDTPEDWQYQILPQVKRPTLDGVKRGTTAVYSVPAAGASEGQDDKLIFLFYSDFSVTRLLSGTISCNVRFQIMTTLDRKLNNVSVRLRWPKMETVLTFVDVVPNQMTHFDYVLTGEGCYSMDKIPNIVVNRCRVKGLSQKECAAKIRWLRK